MTGKATVEHILKAYPEKDYPELESYLTKLRNRHEGVPFKIRPEDMPQQDNHITYPVNRMTMHFVKTRDELYQLGPEERARMISNMALYHLEQEIKAGRFTKNGRTKEYRPHHIPEIDCYIFRTRCPPYSHHSDLHISDDKQSKKELLRKQLLLANSHGPYVEYCEDM